MTNTLHRRPGEGLLERDYVVFMTASVEHNKRGSGPKLRKFLEIALRHNPVNLSDPNRGNLFTTTVDQILGGIDDSSDIRATFESLDDVKGVLEELVKEDLGISVNVSGLLEEVRRCCREVGITRHSVEHSLGVRGNIERLPGREALELNSLCGHGMVSFNLIRKVIEQVKLERLTPREGAEVLARPCTCGVFNPRVAEELLSRLKQMG